MTTAITRDDVSLVDAKTEIEALMNKVVRSLSAIAEETDVSDSLCGELSRISNIMRDLVVQTPRDGMDVECFALSLQCLIDAIGIIEHYIQPIKEAGLPRHYHSEFDEALHYMHEVSRMVV